MNTITRNLMVFLATLSAMMFGNGITGQMSTDISVGDSVSFTTPYTGVVVSVDNWELSTSQAVPYGIAWGLHRPSANSFVSVPREHTVGSGVGISTSVYGVGIQTFYGNDEYWAGRLSYSLWDQTFGLSVDGEEALLIDVSSTVDVVGFPITSSLEYDLSEEGDGAYWIRNVVTPAFAKGASVLVGFNSDDEFLYGLGYKCSDKCYLSTELSADGDKLIRVSYSF